LSIDTVALSIYDGGAELDDQLYSARGCTTRDSQVFGPEKIVKRNKVAK